MMIKKFQNFHNLTGKEIICLFFRFMFECHSGYIVYLILNVNGIYKRNIFDEILKIFV